MNVYLEMHTITILSEDVTLDDLGRDGRNNSNSVLGPSPSYRRPRSL
jgi:hypothetical protein